MGGAGEGEDGGEGGVEGGGEDEREENEEKGRRRRRRRRRREEDFSPVIRLQFKQETFEMLHYTSFVWCRILRQFRMYIRNTPEVLKCVAREG